MQESHLAKKPSRRQFSIAKTEMEEEARGLLEDFDSLGAFRFIKKRGSRQLDDAYELQRCFKALREARGERVIGYKVGCTGPTIRASLGIQESVHGYLWADEQVAHEVVLSEAQFRRLGIEGELGMLVEVLQSAQR